MASPPGQISSGGGAVFIGNSNAGRDIININYITSVRPFARSLHRSLFTSSDQFKPVQDDLAHLMTILETITEDITSLKIDGEKESTLRRLAQDSHQILGQLLDLKEHYDSVGTQTQRTWEREQWRAADLAQIRLRLTSTTSALNTVYIKLIHSSTNMIMAKLDTFIDEVRSGKREGSVVTDHTTGSLSADEKEAWRKLRKELESVGITPVLFEQHHDIIIARLLEAIDNGDLVETLGEELSDDAEGSNSDLAQVIEDRFFDAEEPLDECLTSTDRTHQTVPQTRNQRTNIEPSIPPLALPIRGPSRIAKLLSRVTNRGSRLSVAARNGDEPLFLELLKKGAEVDLKDSDGRTPLLEAAKHGHVVIVRALLKTGKVAVDLKDAYGVTPLWSAAGHGHEAIVRLLLETGKVDVDSKNKYGVTPLLLAAESGHEAIVRLLLETGKVDINLKGPYGVTPLSSAAGRGHEAIVRLLLQTGKVDSNWKDARGRTALTWAAICGHETVVRLLLEIGVDVNSVDKCYQTPLSEAAYAGHVAVVRLLLDTGMVYVDWKNEKGQTPLLTAAQRGSVAIVRLLLKTGEVNVNWKDKEGLTPLLWAARYGHKDVVKLLLKTDKADVNWTDKEGITLT